MRNFNIFNQSTGNTRENRGKLILKERMTDHGTDERYKSTDDKSKQIMQLVERQWTCEKNEWEVKAHGGAIV